MSRSGSHYTIPDENSARAAARLYEQYRARLDADLSRQQRSRVIDVRPSRVALERESPAATRRPQSNSRSVQSQATSPRSTEESDGTARQTRRPRSASEELTAEPAAPTATTFVYEPRSLETGVDLKPSPQTRGVFVDLMA